jgi:hypothetical protein
MMMGIDTSIACVVPYGGSRTKVPLIFGVVSARQRHQREVLHEGERR